MKIVPTVTQLLEMLRSELTEEDFAVGEVPAPGTLVRFALNAAATCHSSPGFQCFVGWKKLEE